MRKLILVLVSIFSLTFLYGQNNKLQGTFVGLEKMWSTDSLGKICPYIDSENPKYTWYHLCTLHIIGNKVSFSKEPIAIYKKDTLYSASDGGFYDYTGHLEYYKGDFFAEIKFKSCDYCPKKSIPHIKAQILPADSTGQTIHDTVTAIKPTMVRAKEHKIVLKIKKKIDPDKIIVNGSIYKRDERIIN